MPESGSDTLTPAQRHTLPGRRALAAKFPTRAEKSAYYRAIGEKGNRNRVTVSGDAVAQLRAAYQSGDDGARLAAAYALLAEIARKADLAPALGDLTPGDLAKSTP